MVTPSLALLFLGIIAAKNDAIIMERCKLAAILRDEGMEGFAGTRIEECECPLYCSVCAWVHAGM